MTENDNKPEEDNMTNSSTAGSAGAPRHPEEIPEVNYWGGHVLHDFKPGLGLTIRHHEVPWWLILRSVEVVVWLGEADVNLPDPCGLEINTPCLVGMDHKGNEVLLELTTETYPVVIPAKIAGDVATPEERWQFLDAWTEVTQRIARTLHALQIGADTDGLDDWLEDYGLVEKEDQDEVLQWARILLPLSSVQIREVPVAAPETSE